MKKIVLLAILIATWYANAGRIVQKYNFEEPKIVRTEGNYSSVLYKECLNFGKEGNPRLPRYGSKLLLDQGEDIVSIRVLEKKFYPEIEDIRIKPAGKILPLSEMDNSKDYEVKENKAVYASNAKYPKADNSTFGTSYKNGHSVGYFNFSPVEYYPAENRIKPVKEISFEIITEPSSKAAKALNFLRGTKNVTKQIASLVDNPGKLNSYRYAKKENKGETYDLLLVTTADLAEYYEDYINYKKETGYKVKVITREEIEANFDGADVQEKIRNAIIDAYQNNEISFVLLGGDSEPDNEENNRIPHRGFYVDIGDTSYNDPDIPSDVYYSALDGNWNDNGNEWFGEVGEDDLLSEVAIGRICGDNEEEVKNQLHKLFMYQSSPVVEDITNGLFVGELLWAPDTYGGTYMDELINGCDLWDFTTEGISENITPYKLYEKEGNWSNEDVYNMFNNTGINLLSHLGHSNVTYNMKLNNPDITEQNFTNDGISRGFVIGYSQGCYCGSFDSRKTEIGYYSNSDCIAEKLVDIKTAEAAFIANSRYGWGEKGNTNGPSHYLHRQFIDALYGENISLIGLANQDSKEDNIAFIEDGGFGSSPYLRWCYYEANLFGDPTMDIWTDAPSDLVCTYPESVVLGETTSLEITTDAARARVALVQNGEILGNGLTDEEGKLNLELDNPISDGSSLHLNIIAHNKNKFEALIYPVTDNAFVVYKSYEIDDTEANNNGLADYNEEFKLNFTVKNIGVIEASEIVAKLSTEDEFVILSDSEEYYGEISSDTELTKEGAFKIRLKDNIPNKHEIKFKVEFFSGEEKLSESKFKIKAYAPVISTSTISIIDENNGFFDASESGKLRLKVQNIGSSFAENISVFLDSQNEKIELAEPTLNLDYLAADSSSSLDFDYTTAADLEIGEELIFYIHVENGGYAFNKTYIFTAGVTEDFEGDFSSSGNDWSFAGNSDWTIDETTKVTGEYGAKSGIIADNQKSSMILQYNVTEASYISFYMKVSSENNYDELKFYIDDILTESWSGELPWEKCKFEIPAGDHKFEWKYEKDGYTVGGNDCAWIDYILIYRKSLGIDEDETVIPKETTLYQNYPNPFNPQTTIKFYNSELGKVNLTIYNSNGQQVATLVNNKLAKGFHSANFDAVRFDSGVYFYRLETKESSIVKKMVLVK